MGAQRASSLGLVMFCRLVKGQQRYNVSVSSSTLKPGFPGLGFVLGYNNASFDRINKGLPRDREHETGRIQWVKAARMPFPRWTSTLE